VPGLAEEVRCGTYEVWEDRERRQGRKIPLKIVVLPATGAPRAADPLVFFAGGPGDSATAAAPWVAHAFAKLRGGRDFVLIDVRGTGGSGSLACSELQGTSGVQGFLDDFLPAAAVRRCRERLEKDFDLTLYTTASAVDDVAEALAALGYPLANLFGVSYGTRSVLAFLERHPDRVRTAVLFGVVPPDERSPLSFARYVQAAFDGLAAECAAEPPCARAFSDPKGDLEAALRRLEAEPVAVEITDPRTGGTLPIRLSRNGLAQTVRYMLYVPSTAALVPLYVHLAAQGEFRPIAETANLFGSELTELSDGFFLSVTCAEDVPFIRPEEIGPAVAGTFLGDFRVARQRQACAAWRAATLPPEVLQPVSSEAPVLLLSGERDPVTPAANGERVARHLPNGLHLVIPDGAHSPEGMKGVECLDGLAASFVAAGTARGLDSSCIGRMERPPFQLAPAAAEIQLGQAELSRFAGRYVAAGGAPEVVVELVEARLRASLAGQPPILLAPVSPTRFSLVGLPPSYALAFEVEQGEVTALVFEEGSSEPLRLPRQAASP
jgi:pimeloyl-ACP methyl ester carboxylesterase